MNDNLTGCTGQEKKINANRGTQLEAAASGVAMQGGGGQSGEQHQESRQRRYGWRRRCVSHEREMVRGASVVCEQRLTRCILEQVVGRQ